LCFEAVSVLGREESFVEAVSLLGPAPDPQFSAMHPQRSFKVNSD
jgi:hypothetical protein